MKAQSAAGGSPSGADGPVFREPWEAQAFALVVALQDGGLFTAAEWAERLGAEIAKNDGAKPAIASESGDPTYYAHWLAALEQLLHDKGIAPDAVATSYRHAWRHAANRTPHGQPIELADGDFAD